MVDALRKMKNQNFGNVIKKTIHQSHYIEMDMLLLRNVFNEQEKIQRNRILY